MSYVDQFIFHISLLSSKFAIFIHLSLLMMTLTVLILAVCRWPVTYELSLMTLLSISSHSIVDRVSPGGYGLDSGWGLRFFLSHACVMLINSPFIIIILDLMSFVYRNSNRCYYWYYPETGGKPLPSSFIKCNQFIAWRCEYRASSS